MNYQLPFFEKYRPKTFEDLILLERVKNKIKNGITTNLILYGSAGIGKSSFAKVLINEFKYPFLWINASLDGRIDTLKETIQNFCVNYSLDSENENSIKVVVLDEVERSSDSFFDAFRGVIEKYAGTTRFILTTNFINKIPDAILSRFESLNFNFEDNEENELIKKYLIRLKHIIKIENIDIEDKAIIKLVKSKYPDLRSIINSLEGFKNENRKITLDDLNKYYGSNKNVFKFIIENRDPIENYKFLLENYSNKVDDILYSLGSEFIEYIRLEKQELIKYIPLLIIKICEYQVNKSRALDPVIVMLACVYDIQNILSNV